MSRTESLLRGAAALAVAGLIIKVSNLLVRVPLTRLLDSEGLGIYQMALPAFHALFHVAAGGVPVAVQNLVAEYSAQGRRLVVDQVLRLALTYAVLAGGGAACLLLVGAPLLARVLGEPRSYWSLVAVAPGVLFFAVDAVYRNYLQGRKLMTPSAMASVLEQATKILVTLAAAYAFLPRGKEYAAGGAALGITAGAVISVLYMARIVRRVRREEGSGLSRPEPAGFLARRMISLAWPVTLGSITMPLLSLLDVGVVQQGFLRAGYLQGTATAMYGAYSGIAVQVVWFPMVLTNALANALVPVLAAAVARGDRHAVRERILMGLRVTGLICMPVAVGVAVLAGPVARLFGEPLAVQPLLYLAPVAYFGPLTWLMTAQLQALGRTGIPMRNITLAMVVKIGLDALLAPVRGVDIKGVAAASVVMFLIACWLNVRTLEQELNEPLPWGSLLGGPLAAATAMGSVLFGLGMAGLMPSSGWAAVCVGILVAPFLYLGTLVATRAITPAELAVMGGPMGSRLERWLQAVWPWS